MTYLQAHYYAVYCWLVSSNAQKRYGLEELDSTCTNVYYIYQILDFI